jgi:7-carboxy-7-deazaguanine synthase
MKVLEIYASINGELPHLGTPTSILRLEGCNLSCEYCDAPREGGMELEVQEVFNKLLSLGHRRVLITGGEPLLQSQELIQLCGLLSVSEFELLFETNGTLDIKPFVPYGSIALDVKLFNLESFRLQNLVYLGVDDALKFVYAGEEDLLKAFEFIHANVPQDASYMIVFSPVLPNPVYLDKFLAFAQAHPFLDTRIQVQVHKILGAA